MCLACPHLLLISRNSTLYLVSAYSNFNTSFPAFGYRYRLQCSGSSLVVLIPPVSWRHHSKVSHSFFLSFAILPSFPLSSCLLVLSPLCHLCLRATFDDGPPLPTGHLRRRATFASGPPSPSGNLCLRATFNPHTSPLLFLFSLFFSDNIGDWIVSVLSGLQHLPSQPLSPSNFCFKFTPDAATQNSNILRDSGFDLHNALSSNKSSTLSFGSEFKPVAALELLLKHHPLWHRVKTGLEQGFQYAMEPISDTDRLAANHDGVLRGNHKSAALHPSALRTLIHDDVNRGYTLPITVPTLLQMKDSVWSPMGVVHQSTIDEHGAIVPKSRGTHDQTFQPTHGISVNDRISSNKLVDCTYGYTLRRILHAIVAYRLQHPHVPILISKIDFDKAYRRVHVSAWPWS